MPRRIGGDGAAITQKRDGETTMSWNRWTAQVLGACIALSALGGCKQPLWQQPGDQAGPVTPGSPPELETSPYSAITPPVVEKVTPNGPPTVRDPMRPPRYMTLKECIALALEQGNFGSQGGSAFQNTAAGGTGIFKQDLLNSFTGQGVSGTDAIRAFALDPAVSGANIERSLSKFDARWITSMSWQKNDNPVAAQFVSFQSQNDQANFSSTLAKPLPTGGVAGITFSVNYAKYSNIPASQQASFVSPNYTPQVQFVFEQPLLQLFGVEVNQLTNTTPTSLLIQGLRPSGGTTTEGILLTRIRFDQSRAEFERLVNFQLINVEAAYWNLYSAYYNLYAQEEGLRQSFEGHRYTEARVNAGTDPPYTLNQARAQFELFRAQVVRARGQVLQAERQLRGLLGLRSDDGFRIVPIDEPNLAPYTPDFHEAANDAIAFRPELALTRQELKVQQLNLLLQRNLRRPDLRFFSSYNVAGIGTRLDGPEFASDNGTIPGNAFRSMANNNFNSWTLGLRLDMPLGFRDANAAVRQAQLQLARSYVSLRDAELKSLEFLTDQHRRVVESYEVLPPLQERRKELQAYVYRFGEKIRLGQFAPQEYFNFLQVQRDLADSIAQEFQAVANYNTALAGLEFAKGTIARYNNVTLGEGPLPPWVGKRAADHIRERTDAAIKVRERPAVAPAAPDHGVGPSVGTPFLGQLPPFAEQRDPLPDTLPTPRKVDPKPDAKPMTPPKPVDAAAGQTARPFPATPTSRTPAQPLPLPTPVPQPGQPGETADPGSYFSPQGTVTLPPRGTAGPAYRRPSADPMTPIGGTESAPPQ